MSPPPPPSDTDRTAEPTIDVEETLALATRAIQRGDDARGIALLRKVLEADPENAFAYHMMGGIHASAGNPEEALLAMSQAVELRPDWSEARFQLGLYQLMSGRVKLAETIWEPLDALEEEDPLRLFKRGMLHLVADEWDACIEALERGVERAPATMRSLANEMRKVVQQARDAKARPSAELPTELPSRRQEIAPGDLPDDRPPEPPTTPPPIPAEHQQAIERFTGYLAQDPDNVELLVTLGDLEHRAHRLDQAAARFERVLELRPDHGPAASRLAAVAITRGDFEEAEQRLCGVLAREDDPALRHNLGLALYFQERFEEARSAFQASNTHATGELAGVNARYLAYVAHHLGDLDEAAVQAKAWCDAQSTIESHGYVALLDMDRGEVEAAYARAEAVLREAPNNVDAAIVRGTDRIERLEMNEADDLFRRALGRQPDNGRAWFGLGLVEMHAHRTTHAIECFQRALRTLPGNGGIQVALGWAHVLLQDPAKAERVFEQAIADNRGFGEAHGGHASALVLQGKDEEARRAVRRARRLDGGGGFGAVFADAILLEKAGEREEAAERVTRELSRELRPGAPSLLDSIASMAKIEAARGRGAQVRRPRPMRRG